MGESRLVLNIDCRFRRPLDVVRSHFLDMRHHVDHDVHKGVRYTILDERDDRCRVVQRFKVLGMTKRDELVLYRDGQGNVVQDFVKGELAGGRLTLRFFADDADTTKATLTFDVPLRGINRLLRPVLQRVVVKTARQALEEDRVDLEERGYQPPAIQRVAV